ncbi:hypothetical protein EYF80_004101 [Liparis tanakae]|uniref:Uncharacterized protein n=1 Tax=Liparis tanakae TaxID=230148 RepID=A0A4Z2J5I6_9TELE|nr:hypothetical protein EYF80_004101 [Liparis tanakae]
MSQAGDRHKGEAGLSGGRAGDKDRRGMGKQLVIATASSHQFALVCSHYYLQRGRNQRPADGWTE